MPISVLIFLTVFAGFYLFLAGYLLLHELMPRTRWRQTHESRGDRQIARSGGDVL